MRLNAALQGPHVVVRGAIWGRGLRLAVGTLLVATIARAGFVVPYELRVGPVNAPERYTVLVFLPEQYRKQWGPTDDLWKLLPRNDHGPENAFAKAYLPVVYRWYLEQIRAHPELYGKDLGRMVQELEAHHGVDPSTGAIVITEYGNLQAPLALLRVAGKGPDGLLATNRQFLQELEGLHFPEMEPFFAWRDLASFEAEPGTSFFDVTRARRVRPHLWVEGENVEFKNFAMKSELRGKLMRYLFHVLWSHQLFALGREGVPDTITTWPDGTPLTDLDRDRMGRRISHIWLGTYGKVLMRFYRTLGFRVWRELNLPEWDKPIFIMRATVRNYARAVRSLKPSGERTHRYWLVHDDALSGRIQRLSCDDRLFLGLAF